MRSYQKLLLSNKAWAKEKKEVRPNYFKDMAKTQKPGFLWIGCSDSRVPAEEITGSSPGEIFVHRNVANLIVKNDVNLLSVLSYAVDYLKVKHVIICAHYGCGGVIAALSSQSFGIIDPWLKPIKDLIHKRKDEITADPQSEDYLKKIIELNLIQQVNNLAETSVIQKAWASENRPVLHGWVFDLSEGELKPCIKLNAGDVPIKVDIHPVKRDLTINPPRVEIHKDIEKFRN